MTSTACARSRSARTRSSTPPTARCSARSRPRRTASPYRSTASASGCAWGRSRSRTAASTSTAASISRGSHARWRPTSRPGRVVEGGSTITQQLVRNLYISREVTFERKLIEACLAVRLNNRRSKEWILANYLNTVYYGNHAYGVEAAAQTYFSKPAWKLTLGQAALLAGLTQAPSVYDPLNNPERAIERRNQVLQALYGTGTSPSATTRRRSATDLKLHWPGRIYTRIREPYFFSFVREQLVIRSTGRRRSAPAGFKVYTTIDRRFQKAANEARSGTLYYDTIRLRRRRDRPRQRRDQDHDRGHAGPNGNQFNLAAQARRWRARPSRPSCSQRLSPRA